MDYDSLHIRQPGHMKFVNDMLGLLIQGGLARADVAPVKECFERESFLEALKDYLRGKRKRQVVSLRFYRWVETTSDPAFKGAALIYTPYGVQLTVKLTRLVLEFVLTGPQPGQTDTYIIACKTHYHCLICHDIKFSADYCVVHFFQKLENEATKK